METLNFMLPAISYPAVWPQIILVATALFVLLIDVFKRKAKTASHRFYVTCRFYNCTGLSGYDMADQWRFFFQRDGFYGRLFFLYQPDRLTDLDYDHHDLHQLPEIFLRDQLRGVLRPYPFRYLRHDPDGGRRQSDSDFCGP